jgi:uncharacterized membrane protein
MNQTHIHLVITHLPIFGSILGALVLLQAIYTKSKATVNAAYSVFILSALGAGIAYFTGEAAEESVEHLQGVSKHLIHEHEEAALYSLISLIVLGCVSLLGFFFSVSMSPLASNTSKVVLVISLLSFILIARTGYMGGQIRHDEISGNSTQTPSEYVGEQEAED